MSHGSMPAYLEPITRHLPSIHGWRDLQRFLATYPDQQRSWRGHLRVRASMPGTTPLEGLALEVARYEAPPDDDLPMTVLVRFEDGQEREWAVRHLEALAVVW
jgi:hypothetical protein